MKFPKFWSLAKSGSGTAWGWSDTSAEEAQQNAQQRAAKVADLLRAGGSPAANQGYYIDRPIREQVLRELDASTILSRNAYGAEVLNTTTGFFIDVDLPAPKNPGLIARLLGAKPAAKSEPSPAEIAALHAAENWAKAHPGWSWRIYRTAAGLRLLATHAVFNFDDALVAKAFEALGSDPLYRQLCYAQQCFRARLTPKPWRGGLQAKTPRWPWITTREEQAFGQWDRSYRQACQAYATCELILTIGSSEIHPSLRTLVAVHDEVSGCGSGRPLA